MEQPPSCQAPRRKVMDVLCTSMKLRASGPIGFEPFVEAAKISVSSPMPMLLTERRFNEGHF